MERKNTTLPKLTDTHRQPKKDPILEIKISVGKEEIIIRTKTHELILDTEDLHMTGLSAPPSKDW